jgi:hypothetical protein
MSHSKRTNILIVFLCLFMGFILRFYTFDRKSLWIDEIHTFNESKDGPLSQLEYYKENPTSLHPPLFFVLTHLFFPFDKPERDLRIIPLIFGILSIPMIYLLATQFSPSIALPCTLSLTLMTYHISLSQDGRSYSMLLFLGMIGLYFFMKYLQNARGRYLILVAFFFSTLFYTSYSSILFIVLSQILWFYRPAEETKKPNLSSFFTLNGFLLLFCLPWVLFIILNYKGQTIMDPLHGSPGPFLKIISSVFNDWVPQVPLMIVSMTLFILFPFFAKDKKNVLILLALFILPISGLYLYCKLFHIMHFITSKYFINFLPLFFIALYLSLDTIELRLHRLKRFLRLRFLFLILLVASNLVILPLYYRSEKQDFRSLVTYLKGNLREGDKIFVQSIAYIPGILHYFGTIPTGRHYIIPFEWKDSSNEIEFKKPFVYENRTFTIYSSNICCTQYVADGNRLWIIHGESKVNKFSESCTAVLKGYFDGSFSFFRKFPSDASMYLFLCDPKSPDEEEIDIPIE